MAFLRKKVFQVKWNKTNNVIESNEFILRGRENNLDVWSRFYCLGSTVYEDKIPEINYRIIPEAKAINM